MVGSSPSTSVLAWTIETFESAVATAAPGDTDSHLLAFRTPPETSDDSAPTNDRAAVSVIVPIVLLLLASEHASVRASYWAEVAMVSDVAALLSSATTICDKATACCST